MRPSDGRVIPTFVGQAIRGEDFTVFGDGLQTRSFCYVDDLVEGLVALWRRGDGSPVNLGTRTSSRSWSWPKWSAGRRRRREGALRAAVPENDPRQRRPDISRARSLLGWEPRVALEGGLLPRWSGSGASWRRSDLT